MEYLDKIKERFSKDIYATETTSIVIENAIPSDVNNPEGCSAKNVVCSFKINPKHSNANNSVMGGAIFTLADYAFAVSANGISEKFVVVTVSSTINFINAGKGEKLIALPKCIKDGKSICVYEVNIQNEQDKLIATVIITGAKKTVSK